MLKSILRGVSLLLIIEITSQYGIFQNTLSIHKQMHVVSHVSPDSIGLLIPVKGGFKHQEDVLPKDMVNYPNGTAKFIPPCCGLKVSTCPKSKYRTLDASCTNSLHPDWGVPNSTYIRLLPAKYADGISDPRRGINGNSLPSARLLRTSFFPNGSADHNLFTITAMQWGQFFAHDMSLLKSGKKVDCCSRYGRHQENACFPIKVPADDMTMGKAGIRCMNFLRTITDKDSGCRKGNMPAQQINQVSSFLDLSNVYGLNDKMNRDLRSMRGGQLRVETRNNKIFPPNEPNIKQNCPCNLPKEKTCYKTGDSRANQNPQLTILHTIFLREHNRIANELAIINPHWSDEKLFQEARRILIAAYQHITYYEWLPIFLGREHILKNGVIFSTPGFVNDYDKRVTPAISNEHAHAAFRYFHTNIPGELRFFKSNRTTQMSIKLSDWFNRPQILEGGSNIDQLTLGMVTQSMQDTDEVFAEEVVDKLLACSGMRFGVDLKAIDFQRDRDHGLAYYNEYRKYCGIKEAKSFDDYADLIEPEHLEILKRLYKNFQDVDLSVGGSLEEDVEGAQAGPTFICIMTEQFRRTRQADKFFFEHSSSGFTQDQLTEIRKSTVARIFCDSGDSINSIQPHAFSSITSELNNVKDCRDIPSIDLYKWKENVHTL